VRAACLRIGLVIGPHGGFLARMLQPARFGLGGHIGSGQQWMSWVHRDDLVAMICLLLEREDLRGAFNGTAPKPVRSREFAHAMAIVLRRPQLPAPVCCSSSHSGRCHVCC
jgi:NAD dependent epimerase/dehydratase family enzyme